MEITRQRKRNISVLMFPWLAHGHIFPFLELAKKLTKRNFYIYFCSTPINLYSIQQNLSPKYSLSIQLVELHLPSLPHLPSHYHSTKGLPPHLMITLKKAFDTASPNFLNILENLKPDLLIYDFIQPWAPSIALSLNIPAVFFLCSSISMTAFMHHFDENPDNEILFPELYPQEYMKKKVLDVLESSSNETKDGDRFHQSVDRSCLLMLAKTFRELEGKYIDYLSVEMTKNIVPVGPLVQETIHEDVKMELIEWLESKEPSSTVFVSFGSEYFLSKEEREEIAHGLELSKVNFIWVIRFPTGEKINLEDALPGGYIEMVKERGLIVDGWLPQAKLLSHTSIGGFVSHCGWSSIMESMNYGVPIIAMPMNLDQPINARLVEDVGVAIEVKRNMSGKLEREEIAKTIRKVVMENGGEDVRKKAREMSNIIRKKGDEDIDVVVHELQQLCNMRMDYL